jgi:hypothetical protein
MLLQEGHNLLYSYVIVKMENWLRNNLGLQYRVVSP